MSSKSFPVCVLDHEQHQDRLAKVEAAQEEGRLFVEHFQDQLDDMEAIGGPAAPAAAGGAAAQRGQQFALGPDGIPRLPGGGQDSEAFRSWAEQQVEHQRAVDENLTARLQNLEQRMATAIATAVATAEYTRGEYQEVTEKADFACAQAKALKEHMDGLAMVVKMAGVNLPAGESLPHVDLHAKVQDMERAMRSMQQQPQGGSFAGGGPAAPLPSAIMDAGTMGATSTAGMLSTAEFDQWRVQQEQNIESTVLRLLPAVAGDSSSKPSDAEHLFSNLSHRFEGLQMQAESIEAAAGRLAQRVDAIEVQTAASRLSHRVDAIERSMRATAETQQSAAVDGDRRLEPFPGPSDAVRESFLPVADELRGELQSLAGDVQMLQHRALAADAQLGSLLGAAPAAAAAPVADNSRVVDELAFKVDQLAAHVSALPSGVSPVDNSGMLDALSAKVEQLAVEFSGRSPSTECAEFHSSSRGQALDASRTIDELGVKVEQLRREMEALALSRVLPAPTPVAEESPSGSEALLRVGELQAANLQVARQLESISRDVTGLQGRQGTIEAQVDALASRPTGSGSAELQQLQARITEQLQSTVQQHSQSVDARHSELQREQRTYSQAAEARHTELQTEQRVQAMKVEQMAAGMAAQASAAASTVSASPAPAAVIASAPRKLVLLVMQNELLTMSKKVVVVDATTVEDVIGKIKQELALAQPDLVLTKPVAEGGTPVALVSLESLGDKDKVMVWPASKMGGGGAAAAAAAGAGVVDGGGAVDSGMAEKLLSLSQDVKALQAELKPLGAAVAAVQEKVDIMGSAAPPEAAVAPAAYDDSSLRAEVEAVQAGLKPLGAAVVAVQERMDELGRIGQQGGDGETGAGAVAPASTSTLPNEPAVAELGGRVTELASRLAALEKRPAVTSSMQVVAPPPGGPVMEIVTQRCGLIESSLKQLDETAVSILEETGKRISFAEEACLSRCKWLDSRLASMENGTIDGAILGNGR
eukprot:SAG22_NODE_16_length_32723_cov_26.404825_37_plen_991_part_00